MLDGTQLGVDHLIALHRRQQTQRRRPAHGFAGLLQPLHRVARFLEDTDGVDDRARDSVKEVAVGS